MTALDLDSFRTGASVPAILSALAVPVLDPALAPPGLKADTSTAAAAAKASLDKSRALLDVLEK
jgi:hypothetical protein